MFRSPQFWEKERGGGVVARMLEPLSWVYEGVSSWREARTPSEEVGVPVLCVGNLVVGGAGKTPTVLAFVKILKAIGHSPHILSRGYGGYLQDTALVNHSYNSYLQVGDEALLLSRVAPTWVGRDRVRSARAAIKSGATILVMDDGLQNPRLKKDHGFVVINSAQGVGNGLVFPAGPLRESIQRGISRSQSILIIDDDSLPLQSRLDSLLQFSKLYYARFACSNEEEPGQSVVAFSGIGYPGKFRRTLEQCGYIIKDFVTFADHHPYTFTDMEKLIRLASAHQARLITTEKDYERVPFDKRSYIQSLSVHLEFADEESVVSLFRELFPVANKANKEVKL